MNLRELVYIKELSQETKYKLLKAIDSPTWVENIFDLIVELDGDSELNLRNDRDFYIKERDKYRGQLEELQKKLEMLLDHKFTVGGIEITVDI
jgi:hypothetical protein